MSNLDAVAKPLQNSAVCPACGSAKLVKRSTWKTFGIYFAVLILTTLLVESLRPGGAGLLVWIILGLIGSVSLIGALGAFVEVVTGEKNRCKECKHRWR
jgi:DNA-directed RNA polymerase subunit RPC12/RpoP